jgi:hypothetical protein
MTGLASLTDRRRDTWSIMDVAMRKACRLQVMRAIFEAADGSESNVVSGVELLDNLGFSDEELGDACKYLEGERLIKTTQTLWGHLTPFIIQLTHKGIKEIEQSVQSPSEPTEHFPAAVSIMNFHAPVIGSAIQSGSPGAQQEMSIGDLDLGAVHEFLREFDARAAELDLPSPEAAEVKAEIATVKAQLSSPKPKRNIIAESLRSVRTILEVTSGSAAAVGLLDLLKLIHL